MYTAFALTGLVITLIISAITLYRNKKGNYSPIRFFNVLGSFIDKYHIVFLLLILLVFLVSRLLKLGTYPNGFHIDELSMAGDAKSILCHGTDRFGIKFPPYFQNYGGGQNALYTYIQAFLLSFLPCTISAFRLQAVFWGVVCLFMTFGICYETIESKGYALMGPVLVTTLPVYIMSERWALESYLLLPFSTIVMYLAIRAIKYEKSSDYFLTGLFMGVSLYTYAPSYIIWPVFLVLTAVYLLYIRHITLKQVLLLAIPLVVLAFPLILFQLVNFGILKPFTLGISDYLPLPEAREKELGLANIIPNLGYIKDLFLGGEELTYNVMPEFGTIYMFLLPFVLIGFIMCIIDTIKAFKMRHVSPQPLLIFFWFASMVFLLLVKGPNINRVNQIFMPFTIFIVIAIYRLFNKNAITLTWLALWTGVSFVFFMYFYFFVQNDVYGLHTLFTSASPGKAIIRSEAQYLKDENTHIYVQYEDIAMAANLQTYYFAGTRDDVFDIDNPTYGNVTAKLPEEIDVNENAVYIIGNQWPHIISYLISEGFAADQTLPGYSILYRLN